MATKGLHRIENPEGIANGVWVTDGTSGFQIKETRYRDENCLPPIESLPWGTSIPARA
jgi:hypothetical protein